MSERRRCLGTVHDRHVIGQDRPFRRCYSTFKKRSPSGEPRLPTPSCQFMATKISGSSRLMLRSSSPTTPSPPAALEPGTASGMESLALLAPQRCHCCHRLYAIRSSPLSVHAFRCSSRRRPRLLGRHRPHTWTAMDPPLAGSSRRRPSSSCRHVVLAARAAGLAYSAELTPGNGPRSRPGRARLASPPHSARYPATSTFRTPTPDVGGHLAWGAPQHRRPFRSDLRRGRCLSLAYSCHQRWLFGSCGGCAPPLSPPELAQRTGWLPQCP